MDRSRPLFCLFSVFLIKQYNFYNKYMWKNVHPVYGARIWTHDLRITTKISTKTTCDRKNKKGGQLRKQIKVAKIGGVTITGTRFGKI